MKYKDFHDWMNSHRLKIGLNVAEYSLMKEAWDAAVNNYPEDTTKADIVELQKIITATIAIECTCDQEQIKAGFRCGCGKVETVQKAIMDLTKYLKALK